MDEQLSQLALDRVSAKYPDLTVRQEMTLDWIIQFIADNHISPSYLEICRAFGWRFHEVAKRVCKHLAKAGYVTLAVNTTRGIAVDYTKLHCPLVRAAKDTVALSMVPPYMSPDDALEFSEAVRQAALAVKQSIADRAVVLEEIEWACPPAEHTSANTDESLADHEANPQSSHE